jgi:hypothetical protein
MSFPRRLPSVLGSFALVLGALCAPAANAVSVQVDITATVTGINDHSNLFNYPPFENLKVGDTVNGFWSYDTSTPYGLIPITGTHYGYGMPDGMWFSTGGGPGAYANFDASGSAVFNLLGFQGHLFPDQAYGASLQFEPNYFDAIPPSALDMSAFLFGTMGGTYTQYPGNYISYTANITHVASVVPLPPAIWLFASALLGVLGMQSRRWRGSVPSPVSNVSARPAPQSRLPSEFASFDCEGKKFCA